MTTKLTDIINELNQKYPELIVYMQETHKEDASQYFEHFKNGLKLLLQEFKTCIEDDATCDHSDTEKDAINSVLRICDAFDLQAEKYDIELWYSKQQREMLQNENLQVFVTTVHAVLGVIDGEIKDRYIKEKFHEEIDVLITSIDERRALELLQTKIVDKNILDQLFEWVGYDAYGVRALMHLWNLQQVAFLHKFEYLTKRKEYKALLDVTSYANYIMSLPECVWFACIMRGDTTQYNAMFRYFEAVYTIMTDAKRSDEKWMRIAKRAKDNRDEISHRGSRSSQGVHDDGGVWRVSSRAKD